MSVDETSNDDEIPPVETDEPVATITLHGSAPAAERRRFLLALQGEADGATYDVNLLREGEGFESYLATPDDWGESL